MAQFERAFAPRYGATQAAYDEGLRQHMLRVYNYMASGLFLTGAVAIGFWQSGMLGAILGTPLIWVAMLAPLAFVLVLSFGINRLSLFASQAVFWAFAAAMGVSMSTIFLVFTGTSIARVFFITAATFAAVSLYGYTTKADLSRFGTFLFMGLIGIVIASLVNMFLGSSALQFAISVIGVLVFTGLTAYDTQMIKEQYDENFGSEMVGKLSIMGALTLYLDFINLLQMLLSLLGQRNNN
jgi:FtsH-binding integral membrane protein